MPGFFSTNTQNPPHWTLNSCFGALYSVYVHLGWFHNCMKLGAKRGVLVLLIQKFVPWCHIGIFRNERTQSAPLDRNSCFCALHSVWVHLGSICNCIKLDAKQGELVQLIQKFVPRSHVGIFRNERTQSTPLDPNSCFGALHSVWVHLGSFRNRMKLDAK